MGAGRSRAMWRFRTCRSSRATSPPSLAARLEDGYVVVDEEAAASVPHVYAAGDMTPGLQLLQIAAADGARAGIAAAQSLRGHGDRQSRRGPHPTPGRDRPPRGRRGST